MCISSCAVSDTRWRVVRAASMKLNVDSMRLLNGGPACVSLRQALGTEKCANGIYMI